LQFREISFASAGLPFRANDSLFPIVFPVIQSFSATPRRLFWNYFFQMTSLGVFLPFFGVYARARGFSFFEISLVTLSIPIIQMFSPPLYGWLADLYISRNILFRLSLILPLLLSPLFYLSPSFPVLLLLILVFGISRSPANSLLNAATMELLGNRGERYGRIRLGGSLGFILFVLLEGFWIQRFGVDHFPDLLIVGLLLSFLAGIQLDLPQGLRLTVGEARGKLFQVVTNPLWILFFAGISLHWGASQGFNLFFANYLQGLSLSSIVSGILWGVAILSESLAFYFSSTLLRLFPLSFFILLGAGVATLRWVLTAWFPSLPVLFVVQLTHGISFGLFYSALILWVHRESPPGLTTTMQGLSHGIMFGIGGGAGQLMSGYIFDRLGGREMFLASAGVNFFAFFCFLLLSGRRRENHPDEPSALKAIPQSVEAEPGERLPSGAQGEAVLDLHR
jgi:PPP family 3-phenylpropionic acid transporter